MAMSGAQLLALLAGAGVAVGLITVGVGVYGREPGRRPTGRMTVAAARRMAGAAATGLVVLVLTRWIAVAVGLALLVVVADRLFGGTRRARLAIVRLQALAGWTESLRDLIATGLALPEALPASVTAAAPAIRLPLSGLADRLADRERLDSALHALADDLDDSSADLVIAALILNSRTQGPALHVVLSSLARSARSELAVRRAIEAERRSTRRAVQFVVAVTVTTALGLALLNPGYVAPYRSAAGQLVLAVVVGIFAVGFGWLARLSVLPEPDRLLAARQPATAGSIEPPA